MSLPAGQSVRVSLDDRQLRDVLRKLGPRARASAGGALYREAQRIMARSRDEFVPVDLGVLKSTGRVAEPEDVAGAVVVVMGYGGPAGPGLRTRDGKEWVGYAVVVHEDLTARHEVGQAKYLERPALEAMGGMGARLAADMRKDLEER